MAGYTFSASRAKCWGMGKNHTKPTLPSNVIELGSFFRGCDDDQADIARLSARVSRFMTEVAFEEFPQLKEMDAKQIREFGNIVTGAAGDFSLKVASLAFAAEE